MLCSFCSNIDLDQLATDQGYKHHASCAELLHSVRNGCESCKLIWDSQWTEIGGDLLDQRYDLGGLDMQIVARAVHQSPGSYEKIRYGQEIRWHDHQSRRMTPDDDRPPEVPYLWSFLAIAARPDDLSSSYLRLRSLAYRSSENWQSSASSWINDCLAGHEACAPQSLATRRPPTRVIDVGPTDGSTDPLLHISGNDVQEWVTLSHCWGQSQPIKTTLQSISDHQHSLPMSNLPKLFYDAVVITRAMHYRYLWIDSLCIIQDSKEDWMREISTMGDIYKNCVFTISAENCADSGVNILGNHVSLETEYVQQGCRSSRDGFQSVMYTFDRERWQRGGLDHSFLKSRAWALQEDVLSPRTLRWTPLQLVWSCRCTTRSEDNFTEDWPRTVSGFHHPAKVICLSPERLEVVRQDDLKIHDGAPECDPLQIWYRVVIDLCSRDITFEEDCLPAISGLAKEVKRHTGYEYRAGIWTQDFHNGLLWSVQDGGLYPSTYVAPSWSWAAIKCGNQVRPACVAPTSPVFTGLDESSLTPIAKILQINLVYLGEDEFGPIKSGELRINAPYKSVASFENNEIRLPLAKDILKLFGNNSFVYKIVPSTITCWLDDRPVEEEDEEVFLNTKLQLRDRGAVVVSIASVKFGSTRIIEPWNYYYYLSNIDESLQDQNWALILEPVIGAVDEWRRIGLARIADGLVDRWESRDFTIL
ncbi:hypothetical protein LHYA1_G005729 [Lachnellula hyalina]|uniref:Heterokaryon incompatibility domain-containing protein n=1 Tax=Lachnellula hyalina TaxID=1316788 RepID=A0A8H8TZY0_9HELO|nr:uncharacterized protein LHYA1_G005729 [Lachnellula hyalina]TVY25481.1 hypothetical protein LHYA1_G005729 [Lachnellula hyalina]